MLKKILDKKIEQFKSDFPNYQISKKTGSLYIRCGVHKQQKTVKYTGRSMTKGIIDKLGKTVTWTENRASYVFLLTPKGKLMYSDHGRPFKSVTLKSINRGIGEVKEVFFIGKKYEWMKDYNNLWGYRFFQGFNSLADAKKFLGFSFISDADFVSLFKSDHYDYLSPMILAKEKKNVIRLLKNIDVESKDLLNDYINMCQDNNIEIEIPAGINKLEELHDNAMWKVNEKNAENYSKECKYDVIEDFTKTWKERGLEFRRLSTPYEMYAQGVKQQHCIGTNYATTLNKHLFYTFSYQGKEYDLQIYGNGGVGQFYGRRNKPAPKELRQLVVSDINFSNKIVDINPNLTNYPMIKSDEEVVPVIGRGEELWAF